MIITGQIIIILLVAVISSFIFNSGIVGVISFFLIPLTLFYRFNIVQLFLSLSLALGLSFLLKQGARASSGLVVGILIALTLILGVIFLRPTFFQSVSDFGVINAQRGEHQNYQVSFIAKLLHNKASNVVYYLDNLVKQLSPSVVFAAGHFPNFSKYIPIAYLFPWYLFLFLYDIKNNWGRYIKAHFLITLGLVAILASFSTGLFNWFLVSGLIWFVALRSAIALSQLDRRVSISIILLNVIYLFLYVLPINYFLYSSLFFL